MKTQIENTRLTVVKRMSVTSRILFGALVTVAVLCIASCSDTDQEDTELKLDTTLGQAVFAEPVDAANAFYLALKNHDSEMITLLLGDGYREVLYLEEVDGEDVDSFIDGWDQANTLLPQGDDKMLIAIGEGQWTLPIPITKGDSGWYFDVDEGRERITIRRIGRNELAAMQAVLAYYDAQMEYAGQDRNGNGMLEYAQRFTSTAGTRDGLFWEIEEGEEMSPLGPLVGSSVDNDYYGYLYRILKAQGESARDGAYSYILGDKMRAGFALIAWPKEYGDSGVMSFIVSHAGIVYEQNLGSDGAETAKAMTIYDPDEDWVPVKEVSGPEGGSAQ